ncbi:MAG: hypothetical protein M5R40_13570 [Anaerolineae bacterium]|nr:hypothetical protein [Anaerolineae bacterium]
MASARPMSASMLRANCGASRVLAAMRCAIVRRMLLSGTRRRTAGRPSPGCAACTSADWMRPPGPVPATACRSTPRSRASRRAAGAAFTRQGPALLRERARRAAR